ncbi:uncharacterized protein LOC122281391 [Carya illinoinensis]|uniref:uncharacterized protein LOC122281391 n=1 Tax=Carya illinoinensis TaxID=32201 RepID=UPI001C71FD71|nr:uncharacterized protein LOC122281391 [Carya illinoinensis]
MGWRHLFLFRCEWFDVGDARRGIHVGDHITSVNTSRKWYKDEPFVLACQAAQVFYLQDNSKHGNWSVVQRVTSRNTYDVPIIPSEHGDEDDDQNLNYAAFQENEPSYAVLEPEEDDNGISSPLHRTDVSPIDVPGDTVLGDAIPTPGDDDFIDDELDENDDYESSSSEDLVTDTGTSSDDGE